jgi:dTDP-4-amino-4,6-dideoxygalactose transaminase
MKKVQFARPQTIEEHETILKIADEILSTGRWTKGPLVARFEERLRNLCHCHAVVTNSGTNALFMAARVADIDFDQSVYMPAFTWPSTVEAFRAVTDHVDFVDIHAKTWLPRFKKWQVPAVPIDMFGSVSTIPHGACVIDGAHSFPLLEMFPKRNTADMVTVSFSASKFVAAGEGGVVLTTDDRLAERLEADRDWSGRMPEFSAALALEALKDIPQRMRKKWEIHKRWTETFPSYEFQQIEISTNHQIVGCLVDHPQQFISENPHLEVKRYWHDFRERNKVPEEVELPVSDYIAQHLVCLPSWIGMPEWAFNEAVEV